jgi:putative ABC transport system ATP-binding protein
MANLIELKDLKKKYVNDGVETPVLHGISFSIPKGQFVAIMGPSGSGKSTLMHILGFLDTATGGMYTFGGRDVSTLTEDQLAFMRAEHVGFIFQAFNLLPKTSVLDNVKLALLYTDVSTQERDDLAMEAIRTVGLGHRVHNLSNQLSGGERQRVAIARAIVTRPTVIFADEPTGNLDSKSGKQIMDTLAELNEEKGHTIILVTHETYTAAYAERVLRMRDGLLESDEKVTQRRYPGDGDDFLK